MRPCWAEARHAFAHDQRSIAPNMGAGYDVTSIPMTRGPPMRMRDTRVIRSDRFHQLQRRHFVVFDVLPFLGTLLALGLLAYRPVGALEISLFFGMWLITGLGLTVGYHRLFTHRAFATGPGLSLVLLVMGSMAGRGP